MSPRPIHAALVLACLCAACAAAREDLGAEEPPRLTDSGADLYGRYCASCHGVDGRGTGPVAPALRTPPTDLTHLAALYGEPLEDRRHTLALVIEGRRSVRAHGTSEMPVWGDLLPRGQDLSDTRRMWLREHTIQALVDHLISMQEEGPEGEG